MFIPLQLAISTTVRTGIWNIESSASSLGNIPANYSVPPWVALEEKGKSSQVLNGEELEINLGYHQVYSWSISVPPRGLINKAVGIPASLPLGRRVGLGEVIAVECNALFDWDKKALGFFFF